MVKTEEITLGKKQYKYTYSDSNKFIEREGVLYEEAYDPIDQDREYTETDIDIPEPEEEPVGFVE
jgi:hypothetical protein